MPSNNFDYPTDTPVIDGASKLLPPWAAWFQRAHEIIRSLQESGPTANRPVRILWLGRRFYDTDLGQPVWVQQVKPTVVWADAMGTPV